eukprot:TRINITY_DN37062_c0_g1_i1.p1 TRINITY_DN37062_c0_g1~~TRINITY_DN37062_c0_g1_i1.p1  ORF type:complete len:424 (+),score=61.42 TRINITY_DN37062_c0_g1_i1:37-1308(+)
MVMSEEYVDADSISLELQCAVCRLPFVEPHCMPCGHTFCMRCLERVKSGEEISCPVCKDKHKWCDVRKSDRALYGLLDNLVVRCPNAEYGCTLCVPRGEVATHVQKYCEMAIIDCPIKGCLHQCCRQDLNTHMASCPFRVKTCEACGKQMPYLHLQTHIPSCGGKELRACPHCDGTEFGAGVSVRDHLSKCEEQLASCVHKNIGCEKKLKKGDMAEHLERCPFESMKGVLKKMTCRLEEQDREIKLLKTMLESSKPRNGSPSVSPSPPLQITPDMNVGDKVGTLVEFQWFIQVLKKPRGSLISPNFSFADLEWQLSIDGSDNGIYLAANGRGVTATYMISVAEGDLNQTQKRNWVSHGCQEFGVTKWGCPGIMYCYYEKGIVVTAAFTHVISPINIVSQDNSWVVGVDSHHGTASSYPPAVRT